MSTPYHAEGEPLTGLLGKFWTFANVLSLIRLVLVAPVAYLILIDGSPTLLWSLIGLAIATDFFDGHVARWSHTVSSWGKVLDPLADKVAGATVTLALVVRESLPAWFLALLVVRDTTIFLGGVVLARRTAQVVMSLWLGKLAVGLLSVTIVAALLKADPPIMQILVWTTAGLLSVSFVQYMIRFIRLYHSAPERAAAHPQLRRTPARQSTGGELEPEAYAERR